MAQSPRILVRLTSLFFVLVAWGFLPQTLNAKTSFQRKNESSTTGRPSYRTTKETVTNLAAQEKDWNVLVYIAGNNNLYRFVEPNLKQMEAVGSNKHLNILCQVDQFGSNEMKRYEIHKNSRRTVWRTSDFSPQERRKNPLRYASGTPEGLESFLEWAINTYPAKKQFLVLWNHGCGIIDPYRWGRLITELHHTFFVTDPVTGQMKLNREENIEEFIEGGKRGIAFNDSNSHFLTNQDLSVVLNNIRKKCPAFAPESPGGPRKKFDLIGMDACCMANIEIGTQIRDQCDYLVSSQEVILGAGWNYKLTLDRASKEDLSARALAHEIIKAYEKEYMYITPDYTLSVSDFVSKASNTNKPVFVLLEEKINTLADLLITLMRGPMAGDVVKKLKEIRRKSTLSTWFYDNNYIDLHHFLVSLQKGLRTTLNREAHGELLNALATTITDARNLLKEAVPFFTAGSSFIGHPLPVRARGLSIYLPTRIVHNSYERTLFAQNNAWAHFLSMFVRR